MSSPTRVLFWAEGPTDRAAAKALIVAVGAEPGPDYSKRHKSASGKDRLDDKLAAYNAAAEYEPFLVLRDLDKDADCAPTLVQKKLPARSKFICFRVVVRSIEAWLMADARAFAEWVQVNQMQVPVAPEELENPKDQLLALVRRSRSREVKSDLLPAYGSGRLTGPLYAVRLQEFIEKFWDVRRVVKSGRAPSLTRALACLEQAVSSYQGR